MANLAGEDEAQIQEYAVLHCNFPCQKQSCGRVIKEGVLLRCRHIFCNEHAQQWFLKSEECPVCMDGPAKRREVGREDDRERVRLLQELLVTSTPLEAQEAASVTVELWEAQKAEEFAQEVAREQEIAVRITQLNRSIKKRLKEAEDSFKSRVARTEDLRRRVREAEQLLRRDKEYAATLASQVQHLHASSERGIDDLAGLTPTRKRLRNFLNKDLMEE